MLKKKKHRLYLKETSDTLMKYLTKIAEDDFYDE